MIQLNGRDVEGAKAFLLRVSLIPFWAAMIEVPEDILWDYQHAPEDVLWRLQRIADFFPLYGKDRETIAQLYAHRNQLKLDGATLALIEAYHALLETESP